MAADTMLPLACGPAVILPEILTTNKIQAEQNDNK